MARKARKFDELRRGMSSERLARNRAAADAMMVEMLLSEIRREAGLTQVEVAGTLGIKQPSLSKLESQEDMQISTLRRIIGALGGELELIAHLPGMSVRLTQFLGK